MTTWTPHERAVFLWAMTEPMTVCDEEGDDVDVDLPQYAEWFVHVAINIYGVCNWTH